MDALSRKKYRCRCSLALLVQKYDARVFSAYLLYLLGAVAVGCRSFLSFLALLVQELKK
jgi:hypothetical protein